MIDCDVLILGGSFTGIELVRRLQRDRVGRTLRIRVVDRQIEHPYIPLGHELLTERLPYGVEAGTVLASSSYVDRFAPNVLVLPDRACLAGMAAEDAVGVVESHLAGDTDPRWLRGVTGLHPAEQVALGTVLERFGPGSSIDWRTRVVDQQGVLGAGRWTVDVVGPAAEEVRVVVDSGRAPTAARLTCRAVRETHAPTWSVVSVSRT